MKKDTFKKGDLVAVLGGSIEKNKNETNTAVIAIVLVDGLNDLIVEVAGSVSSTTYTVPKCLCKKLDLDATLLKKRKVSLPEIGDLVMSYDKRPYSNDPAKEVSGVLYKVDYKLGVPDTCTLMCGTDLVEVKFSTVILLQREKR